MIIQSWQGRKLYVDSQSRYFWVGSALVGAVVVSWSAYVSGYLIYIHTYVYIYIYIYVCIQIDHIPKMRSSKGSCAVSLRPKYSVLTGHIGVGNIITSIP